MEIIYFASNVNYPFSGDKIANDLDIRLYKTPIESWKDAITKILRGTLILVDHTETSTISEDILLFINNTMSGLVTCIILTDKMDFETRISYYNLGVSAILQRSESLEQELQQHFLFAWKESQIISGMKKMKIAVLDDSIFFLEVIKSYFSRVGINNVDCYNDAKGILKRVNEYELFIIDLVLPSYSGQELAYLIKRENYNAIVMIMTAYGGGISISQNEIIGADDFLIKPFDFKAFILRLTACIRNKIVRREKCESEQQLQEMATKDTLTNVYNRRYFVDFLDQQVKNFNELKVQFSLILLDIDHFKNINDEHGHLIGDQVLQQIAMLLKKSLRENDVICRWGGEEFIIFLVDTRLEAAGMVAEKLRKNIEEMRIEGVSAITASFGATQWAEGDDATSLFKRIDNSLYLAKLTGRNKVVSNEEVYIYKGGLPVSIEWGPFFRSGNVQIDKEHNELISISNELILNCFIENNDDALLKILDRLVNHIQQHFESEESILREYAYEDYEEHKEIHAALLLRTSGIMKHLREGKLDAIELSKFVIQEVVVGHIIKSDFKFYNLFYPK